MRISDWSSDVCSSDLGWLPALALTFIVSLAALAWRNGRRYGLVAIGLTVALVVVKVASSLSLVTVQVGAACFLIAAIAANVSRTRRRHLAQRENPVSGLPNFEALRSQTVFGRATGVASNAGNLEYIAEIGKVSGVERV